ncbi:O-antigen ligase family protein [Mycolicibacterium komossense]|uniref:O-antigen ligase family protein n=1 Tax=Mycolicibacterium komossense TaxID=1779 RepID=A0ABT3CCE1_9MYCO|nr:O-antigen ligase family protein [Mycolicibacterium komossense]MCV7227165.1 O-antigen ligase family protein [Mycolicibacterium komossense]
MAAFAVFGCASAVVTLGVLSLIPIKITFFYLLVVVALWLAPFTAADRDKLVTIVLAVGTINASWGIAQQFLGEQFLVDLGYKFGDQVRTAGDMLRSFGTFNQPFGYGLFLMLTILIGLTVALGDPRRRRNQVFLCLLPVLVAGMVLSVVRASYVGLAVGLLWIGVFRYRKVLAGLAITGVVAVPVILLAIPKSAIATVFSPDSFGTRAEGWRVSWLMILDKPWGAGLGRAGSAADKLVTDPIRLPDSLANRIDGATAYSMGVPYQPDNYYVKILIELGPVGLWFFLMFVVAALVSTLKVARKAADRIESSFAIGVGAVLAAAMVASFVSTYLEIFPMDYYTWLLLGAVGSIPLSNNLVRTEQGLDAAPAVGALR